MPLSSSVRIHHQESRRKNPRAEFQNKAPRTDKKVNSSRRKSPFRDARFISLPQGLPKCATDGDIADKKGASVIESSTPTDTLTLTPSSVTPTTTPFTSLPKTAQRSWKRYLVPADSLRRKYRKAAPWRDLSDEARILFYHRGMKALGAAYSFTLNLNSEIGVKARAQAKPCDWLYRRIRHELKLAFGRDVPIWFTLEETDDRHKRLHVHGEIGIAPEEAKTARRALRRAGGVWRTAQHHQCHLGADPDEGWPCYCFKQSVRHLKRLAGTSYGATFQGNWFSVSQNVTRAARKAYETAINSKAGENKSVLTYDKPLFFNNILLYERFRLCESSSVRIEHDEGAIDASGGNFAGRIRGDLRGHYRQDSDRRGRVFRNDRETRGLGRARRNPRPIPRPRPNERIAVSGRGRLGLENNCRRVVSIVRPAAIRKRAAPLRIICEHIPMKNSLPMNLKVERVTADEIDALHAKLIKPEELDGFYAITGNPPHPVFSKEHDQEKFTYTGIVGWLNDSDVLPALLLYGRDSFYVVRVDEQDCRPSKAAPTIDIETVLQLTGHRQMTEGLSAMAKALKNQNDAAGRAMLTALT